MNTLTTDQNGGVIRQPTYPGSIPGGTDAGELVEKLLSNEHIPEHLANAFWVLFGRTAKLTFITEEDRQRMMLRFEYLRITALECIPPGEYQEQAEQELYSIGMEFEMNLMRARGVKGMNERILMGASTYATFSERPIGQQAGDNIGLFGRVINASKNAIGLGDKQQ